MELCREVGTSFEAVPHPEFTTDASQHGTMVCLKIFTLVSPRVDKAFG